MSSTAVNPASSAEKARKLLSNVQKGSNELANLVKAGSSFFDYDFESRRNALQKAYVLSLQISPQFIGEHIDSLVWHHAFYAVIQSLANDIDKMRAAKRGNDLSSRSRLRLAETRIKMLLNAAIGFYEHAQFLVTRQLRNALDLKTKQLLLRTLTNCEELLEVTSSTLVDATTDDMDTLYYSTVQDGLLDDRLANLAHICIHLGDLHRYASVRGGQRHVHEAAARKLYRIAAATWPREAGAALAQLAVCSSQRVVASDVPIIMFLLLAMVSEKPPRNALENAKKRLQINRTRLAKERTTQRHASLSTFICSLFEIVHKLILHDTNLGEISALCESTLKMFDELDRVEVLLAARQKPGRKLYGDVLFRLCVVVIAAAKFTRRRVATASAAPPASPRRNIDPERHEQIASALFLSIFLRLLLLATRYLTTRATTAAAAATTDEDVKAVPQPVAEADADTKTQTEAKRKSKSRGKMRLRRRAMFDEEDADGSGSMNCDSDVFDDSDDLDDDSSDSMTESGSEEDSDSDDANADEAAEPTPEAETENQRRLNVRECIELMTRNRDCAYVLAALKLCCDQLRANFDPACFVDTPNSLAAGFRTLASLLPDQNDLVTYIRNSQIARRTRINPDAEVDQELESDYGLVDYESFEFDLDQPYRNLLAEDMYTLSPLTINGSNVNDRQGFVDSVVNYFEYAAEPDLQSALRVLDIVDCYAWFAKSKPIAQSNIPIKPDEYVAEEEVEEEEVTAEDEKMKKLEKMRQLAKLRLQAQVNELEQNVRDRQAQHVALLRNVELSATHTVCAVVDATVLCEQLALLRNVMNQARRRKADVRVSKKHFLFIVPQTVIAHLDQLKNEDPRSREASRFLETEIHSADTLLHFQQHTESIPSSSKFDSNTSLAQSQRRKEPEEARAEQVVACARYFTKLVGDFRKDAGESEIEADSQTQAGLANAHLQFARFLVVILTNRNAPRADAYVAHLSIAAAAEEIPVQSLTEFDRYHFNN